MTGMYADSHTDGSERLTNLLLVSDVIKEEDMKELNEEEETNWREMMKRLKLSSSILPEAELPPPPKKTSAQPLIFSIQICLQ